MLIEQIIEFELRGLGPLAVHVLLQLVIFMTKQKSLRNIILLVGYFIIYCLRNARGNVLYFPLTGPNHFQNLPQNGRF